jgi:hypothetical protein
MDFVCIQDLYFLQKCDACDLLRFSPIQKCTSALRNLAYGLIIDMCDEYQKLKESTTMESIKRFVVVVHVVFEAHYIHRPTLQDFGKQLVINV